MVVNLIKRKKIITNEHNEVYKIRFRPIHCHSIHSQHYTVT